MTSSSNVTEDDERLLSMVDNRSRLEELLREKDELGHLMSQSCRYLKNTSRLLNREICRVVDSLSKQAGKSSADKSESLGPRVSLSESVPIPVDKYPNFNFIGRILGPRGLTAKKLEESTGCKIVVRGSGSSRHTTKPDSEPLHVLIQCEDFEKLAHIKMKRALEEVHELLVPPEAGKDYLKRQQMVELSIMNGTHRPTPFWNAPPPLYHTGMYHTPPPPIMPQYSSAKRGNRGNFAPLSPKPKYTPKNREEPQLAAAAAAVVPSLMATETVAPVMTDAEYKQKLSENIERLAIALMSQRVATDCTSPNLAMSSTSSSLASPGYPGCQFAFGSTYNEVFGGSGGGGVGAVGQSVTRPGSVMEALDQYRMKPGVGPFGSGGGGDEKTMNFSPIGSYLKK